MGNTGGGLREGSQQYASGNTYVGQFKGKKRHGRGTYTWPDGGVYEGEWANNEQSGRGKMRFPNGNVYEGDFKNNNPNGMGSLRTVNGEVISGRFSFVGRSATTLNAYNSPVATYNLDVTVLDSKSDSSQRYVGKATLHLATGLVVLPGMADPSAPVLPFAVQVVGVSNAGRDLFNAGMTNSTPAVQAIAEPVDSPAPHSIGYGPTGSVAPADPLQQSLLAAEHEHNDYAVAQATAAADTVDSGVAYGVHDPALNPQPGRNGHGQVNVLNPRNYF